MANSVYNKERVVDKRHNLPVVRIFLTTIIVITKTSFITINCNNLLLKQ